MWLSEDSRINTASLPWRNDPLGESTLARLRELETRQIDEIDRWLEAYIDDTAEQITRDIQFSQAEGRFHARAIPAGVLHSCAFYPLYPPESLRAQFDALDLRWRLDAALLMSELIANAD